MTLPRTSFQQRAYVNATEAAFYDQQRLNPLTRSTDAVTLQTLREVWVRVKGTAALPVTSLHGASAAGVPVGG